jgi:hypothetical protein
VNRLRHSLAGFLRSMQMSAANIALVTEGRLDRVFYAGIVTEALKNGAPASFTVRSARELPDIGAGGKPAVLGYYAFLRRRRSLSTTLGGKKTIMVFCLDKDLDDLTHRCSRSAHVIYTELFDVESYLFRYGDILSATSFATTVDAHAIATAIAPADEWAKRAAETWRDWVALCVFEVTRKQTITGNYGVCPSPIHDSRGVLDENALTNRLAGLRHRLGLSPSEFDRHWSRNCQRVSNCYTQGKADTIFKGKWYCWLLAYDLKRSLIGRDFDQTGLKERLPHHLMQNLDFKAPWTNGLREKFKLLFEREFTRL